MLTNLHPYRPLAAMGAITTAAIVSTLSPAPLGQVAVVFLLMQLSVVALPVLRPLTPAKAKLRFSP